MGFSLPLWSAMRLPPTQVGGKIHLC